MTTQTWAMQRAAVTGELDHLQAVGYSTCFWPQIACASTQDSGCLFKEGQDILPL